MAVLGPGLRRFVVALMYNGLIGRGGTTVTVAVALTISDGERSNDMVSSVLAILVQG